MHKGRLQVLQLHGSLAPELQDRAIRGGGGNRTQGARRVILSTPIAESSVTIDGVRVVVDSGLRRSPAYDVQTGKVGSHPAVGWLTAVSGNTDHKYGERWGRQNIRSPLAPGDALTVSPGYFRYPATG